MPIRRAPDDRHAARRPLAGRRVLVTRARDRAAGLMAGLRALGAEPIHVPTIRSAPPADIGPLEEALARVGTSSFVPQANDSAARGHDSDVAASGDAAGYDWLVVTSARAVPALVAALDRGGRSLGALGAVRVAAVGPTTAAALADAGRPPDLVPEVHRAEALAEALIATDDGLAGARVLLPRADIARAALPEALRAAGAVVDEVVAYRTVRGRPDPAALAALEAGVDVATFTSGSTVRNLAALAGDRPLADWLAEAVVACIGPATAAAAERNGLTVDIVANPHSIAGLLDAIAEHFEETP